MRHLAAYLLLVAGGNTSPSAEDITALLSTVGIETDSERLEQLLNDLGEKTPDEIFQLAIAGRDKLCAGGGAPGGGGSSAASTSAAAPAAAGQILI